MIIYKTPVFLFCKNGYISDMRGIIGAAAGMVCLFLFLAGNTRQARIAADYLLYAVMNAYIVSVCVYTPITAPIVYVLG